MNAAAQDAGETDPATELSQEPPARGLGPYERAHAGSVSLLTCVEAIRRQNRDTAT